MELKKLAPWNWFKKEEESVGGYIPIRHPSAMSSGETPERSLMRLRHEVDDLFSKFFGGFGYGTHGGDRLYPDFLTNGLLKPHLDIASTEKEYAISVEVPGVDQKDVKLEIAEGTLTVSGEKKQESEEKNRDYYRIERSYGSFQRVLSLPEDVDEDSIKATFKNGVLKITMTRKPVSRGTAVKQIEIK